MRRYFVLAVAAIVMAVVTGCGGNKDASVIPSSGDVTAGQIIGALRSGKRVYLKDRTITGMLDFTTTTQYCGLVGIVPVYVEPEIVFLNCVFEDSVTTFSEHENAQKVYTVFDKNVVFHDCEFKRGVNFTQADFRGRFDFDISKVHGVAAFDGCNFRNGTSFAMANFNEAVTFVSTVFAARSNFLKSFFRKSAIFQRCRMEDMVMFADSHFYGYTEFIKIVALGDIDFTNTQFAGRTFFKRSVLLGNIKLSNCVFKDSTDFSENTQLQKSNTNLIETIKAKL